MIAGDTLPSYENLRQRNPFPVMVDVAGELDAYERLIGLVASEDRLVAGRDPAVLSRFERLPAGDASIACLHSRR